MKLWLLSHWQALRMSYWFIPTVMSIAAALLAIVLLGIDAAAHAAAVPGIAGFQLTDSDGSRVILSTLAGSAITVAGVVFSIAMLVLSTASTQFGPRLLPNFMLQGGTQFVLGGFLATFIYALIVLTRVRGGLDGGLVPQLSVSAALLLGIGSFALLIHFIQRVSLFIQAPRIIDSVANGLVATFGRLFPDMRESGIESASTEQGPHPELDLEAPAYAIRATSSGYLEAVDLPRLVDLARDHGCILRLLKRPGDFVVCGHRLVLAFPCAAGSEELAAAVQSCFWIGPERTDRQDAEYAVDQLVEVAVRALSPGTNDPFTAIQCIDWLGAALSVLVQRRMPAAWLRDADGDFRLLSRPFTYEGIFDSAFNQIRQHGRANEAVAMRLLETIATLTEIALPQEARGALLRHAMLIYEDSLASLPQARDREDLAQRYNAVCTALRDECCSA